MFNYKPKSHTSPSIPLLNSGEGSRSRVRSVKKRPIISLIIATVCWLVLGLILWLVPPAHWSLEFLVFAIFCLALWLSLVWAIGHTKRGTLISLAIILLLLLRRLDLLNWTALGVIAIATGLLSLII